jgi:hypothetical protein
MRKFGAMHPPKGAKETFTAHRSDLEITESSENSHWFSHLTLCNKTNLDAKNKANDEVIDEWLDLGYYTRRKVSSNEKAVYVI